MVYIAGGTNRELSCDAVVRVPLLSKIARDYTAPVSSPSRLTRQSLSLAISPHTARPRETRRVRCAVWPARTRNAV